MLSNETLSQQISQRHGGVLVNMMKRDYISHGLIADNYAIGRLFSNNTTKSIRTLRSSTVRLGNSIS